MDVDVEGVDIAKGMHTIRIKINSRGREREIAIVNPALKTDGFCLALSGEVKEGSQVVSKTSLTQEVALCSLLRVPNVYRAGTDLQVPIVCSPSTSTET